MSIDRTRVDRVETRDGLGFGLGVDGKALSDGTSRTAPSITPYEVFSAHVPRDWPPMTGSFSSTNVKVVDEAPSNVTRGKSAVVARIASMLFRGSRQAISVLPFASFFRIQREPSGQLTRCSIKVARGYETSGYRRYSSVFEFKCIRSSGGSREL